MPEHAFLGTQTSIWCNWDYVLFRLAYATKSVAHLPVSLKKKTKGKIRNKKASSTWIQNERWKEMNTTLAERTRARARQNNNSKKNSSSEIFSQTTTQLPTLPLFSQDIRTFHFWHSDHTNRKPSRSNEIYVINKYKLSGSIQAVNQTHKFWCGFTS